MMSEAPDGSDSDDDEFVNFSEESFSERAEVRAVPVRVYNESHHSDSRSSNGIPASRSLSLTLTIDMQNEQVSGGCYTCTCLRK
jgi:hypothetical protein